MKECSTYDLPGRVIGLAMKVHRILGPGFLENIYANALALELEEAGISFQRESRLDVLYRDHLVGQYVCDFLIEEENEKLILELKSVSSLIAAHEVQLVNYLTATKIDHGVLFNFGGTSLEYKKKFRIAAFNSVNSVNSVKTPAFTLLELLVALAVLSILVVMMMGLVTSATALWRTNENRADAYREARAALSIMSRDLAGTIATQTNHFLPNASANALLAGSNIVFDPQRQGALLFVSALPANAQQSGSNRSDVCQVGYFLAFDRTSMSTNLPGGQPSLNLYRYFLSSDPTFLLLTNSPVFPSGITPLSDTVDLLAKNVREFRVTPLVFTNGTYSTNFSATTNSPLPDLLEISLTAVNREAAKQLPDLASWKTASPPDPILRGQQTFTTRIPIAR